MSAPAWQRPTQSHQIRLLQLWRIRLEGIERGPNVRGRDRRCRCDHPSHNAQATARESRPRSASRGRRVTRRRTGVLWHSWSANWFSVMGGATRAPTGPSGLGRPTLKCERYGSLSSLIVGHPPNSIAYAPRLASEPTPAAGDWDATPRDDSRKLYPRHLSPHPQHHLVAAARCECRVRVLGLSDAS
jgi:hypothetical protein